MVEVVVSVVSVEAVVAVVSVLEVSSVDTVTEVVSVAVVVATALGNFLVSIPGFLWGKVPLVVVWGVLVGLCLISFIFIFSVMKKLEKVC